MKKLFALLLAMVMVLSLFAACGSEEEAKEETKKTTESQKDPATEPEKAPENTAAYLESADLLEDITDCYGAAIAALEASDEDALTGATEELEALLADMDKLMADMTDDEAAEMEALINELAETYEEEVMALTGSSHYQEGLYRLEQLKEMYENVLSEINQGDPDDAMGVWERIQHYLDDKIPSIIDDMTEKEAEKTLEMLQEMEDEYMPKIKAAYEVYRENASEAE